MYLIAGLGNPGKQYENTRHNVGYRVIALLAKDYHVEKLRQQKRGLTAMFTVAGKKILLCEPLTFMNLSGACIGPLARYYDIPDDHVIVVYDDIDLPLGDVRVRASGGPGTHNGMKSIVKALGTKDFPRVRLGIGPKHPKMDLADFVLSRFSKSEEKEIDAAAEQAAKAAVMIVTDGIDKAMNAVNTRKTESEH